MVKKVSIAGNGIVGLMIAYLTHLRARENNERVRVTMRGTYPVAKTTAGYLFPSITENEILSVVPPGKKLLQSLDKLFKEFNGGIRVDSPTGILDSAQEFIQAVEQSGSDEEAHQRRTELLSKLGQYSVSLWESIYQSADDKLKKIFEESNYLPCREQQASSLKLRDGYRIDLYFDAQNLNNTIQSNLSAYAATGYVNSQVLTPDQLEVTN